MDLKAIFMFELQSKEIFLAGLSELEAETLIAFIEKATRPQTSVLKDSTNDAEVRERDNEASGD